MHPNELTLSEYVDRTLGRDEHGQVARHLETCEACRRLVDDLRGDHPGGGGARSDRAASRVWGRIEQEIRGGRARATNPGRGSGFAVSASWTWLAAAAVLVTRRLHRRAVRAAHGAGCRQRRRRGSGGGHRSGVEGSPRRTTRRRSAGSSGLPAPRTRRSTPTRRPRSRRISEVINQAIDESRAAVRSAPASQQAQYSLIENFKTKLALLQDTVALINELRAGNDAAAARIASGS